MAEQGVIHLFSRGAPHSVARRAEHLRAVEAILFAADGPVAESDIARRLPKDTDCPSVLAELQADYAGRGVNLVRVAGKWCFRTAPDLAYLMTEAVVEPKRLSRAALETLAIIAYHQPVTRAEIEEIRGVSLGKGTLDLLIEIGWVRLRGRRKTPGRPVAYGTSNAFLEHFGLDRVTDLPGIEELIGAGLLDRNALPGAGEGDVLPELDDDTEFEPLTGDEGDAR